MSAPEGRRGGVARLPGSWGRAAVLAVVIYPHPVASLRADPVALRPDISIRKIIETGTGGNSIRIASDPTDRAIYYLRKSGSIYRLTLAAGAASTSARIYQGTDTGVPTATGFAFGPDGTLYVLGTQQSGQQSTATVRAGIPTSPGGDARDWVTVARTDAYPRSNTAFDHNFNGIAVSPDGGFVFLNSGSRTDHGEVQSAGGAFPGTREVPLTSAIFRVPASGRDLLLPNDEGLLRSGGYLFADGLRNSFDLAFAPNGDLLAGENSGDRDDNEELNWIREGGHYGFPWRMGDSETPQQFAGYDPEVDELVDHGFYAYQNGFFHDDPTYPPAPDVPFIAPIRNAGPDADSFRDPVTGDVLDASDQGTDLGTFTAHRSPLGLVFDAAGVLGEEFRGGAFILGWTAGDSQGDSVNGPFRDPGEDLLHLDLRKTGDSYEVATRRIASGFDNPIDAEIIGDRIYVLDYGGSGTVWEVTLPASSAPSLRRGHVNEDDGSDLSDAVAIFFFLFLGRPIGCRDAADMDDGGTVDIADAIYLLSYLFAGGPAPVSPWLSCGPDTTVDGGDDLGCEASAVCGQGPP
jgi:glucose/arabinose dehydrogenase